MSELFVNDLISVGQAIGILDAVELHPRRVQLPLLEATGLILAEDIFADRDYPPFDKAVMDGFAIRAEGGTKFTIIETVSAGQSTHRTVGPGEAIAIMTGAPLPSGADAIVPVEWTTRDGDQFTMNRLVKVDHAIARKGSDSSANKLLLEKGMKLGPAQIAVAANVGKHLIEVYAAPRVALLSTGDELVPINQTPVGSQIRNSNAAMLTALLRQLGCEVQDLGIVRDDRPRVLKAIDLGMKSDALFVTGGMSMGERDYVPGVLRELGMDLKISKLRIKPGKPFVFATGKLPAGINPSMVFGLPGNPVSAFVCTLLLASRVLAKLAGRIFESGLKTVVLSQPLVANGNREFYIPAQCLEDQVTPLRPNGSADLFTLAMANALLVRPENAPAAKPGDRVQIVQIP